MAAAPKMTATDTSMAKTVAGLSISLRFPVRYAVLTTVSGSPRIASRTEERAFSSFPSMFTRFSNSRYTIIPSDGFSFPFTTAASEDDPAPGSGS